MSDNHQDIYDHLGLDTAGESQANSVGETIVSDIRKVASKALGSKPNKKTNVMVVFTQEGEHVHSWEATLAGVEASRMIEAACCSGLVDESLPLSFIVYNDDLEDGIEDVLMEGVIHPSLLVG